MASETSGPKGQPYFTALGAPAIDVDPGIVSDYAADNGNRKSLSRTDRLALPVVWEGLEAHDQTDKGRYEYIGGSWVRRQLLKLGSGRYNGNGVLVGTPAWTDLITITAVSTGGVCSADWTASFFNGASGANRSDTFQVVCDGVLIWDQTRSDVPLATGSVGVSATGLAESSPGAGTHTWKLQGNASVSTAVQVRNATLKITEV